MSKYATARGAEEPPAVEGARWIALTQGHFLLVDDEDFERANAYNWTAAVSPSGALYSIATVNGKRTSLHRFIMGDPVGRQVDHYDGKTWDCRKRNLRVASHADNQRNQKLGKANHLGVKGVHTRRNRFRAQITVGHKSLHIGTYDTLQEAADAYDEQARKHFGEFACVNSPRHGERSCITGKIAPPTGATLA